MRFITVDNDRMDSPIDLHTVSIVRAIADHGTISAAAASLGYSQPAVSQHLRRIEAKLGMPLVVRAGRGVRLTEPGQVLARHALAIASALDAAAGDLADLAGLAAGAVRIAGFPTASSTIVPTLLRSMRDMHPGITVAYVEAEPPEAIGMLRDGSVDLAITFAYPGDRADPHHGGDSALETIDLFEEPVVIALPDRAAPAGAVSLAELGNEKWIAGCPLCRGHLLAACEEVGMVPRIELETDNATAVLSLVASGLGVALLPQLALATAAVPPGAEVRPTTPAGIRTIHAVLQPGSHRVPSVSAALDRLLAIDGASWGLTTAAGRSRVRAPRTRGSAPSRSAIA